jgi:predicted Holliday junction resolvase-like endonuclease
MNDMSVSTLIREQRHIFGVCPHCTTLFRLVDIQISYNSEYVPDWLDRIEKKQEELQGKMDDLESREREMRDKAINKATQRELPKRLKKIIPSLIDSGFNPQDVKTLFHPVDFVVFDGMNARGVDRIVFLDHSDVDGNRRTQQQMIKGVIQTQNYHWATIRISGGGEVTLE